MTHVYSIRSMRETKVVRYSSHGIAFCIRAGCSGWSVVFTGGSFHALDNICNPAGPVVVGDGQLLHAGWLHPHLACNSFGCPGNKPSIRTARCSLK